MDLGKTIVTEASHDKELEDKIKFLVMKVVASGEVRYQMTELIKDVFSSQEATDTLVDLLNKGKDWVDAAVDH